MAVLYGQRCEIEGCHNRTRTVTMRFYGGQVKRVCPMCLPKYAIELIQTPVVERKKMP